MFSIGNGQPRDRHCANCVGTVSFPISATWHMCEMSTNLQICLVGLHA